METKVSKPVIFLNRIKTEGNSLIKLYFIPNEKIEQRIKQNDWINYNVKLSSWYVGYSRSKYQTFKLDTKTATQGYG
ncbi:MAG: hypothetical protein B6D61_02395 [Bacteroidetes bacterium 4484_249]|nr:MAG: hypothetical protein B6D61_02395 [Bacteroidetes bacterium 4484_249]